MGDKLFDAAVWTAIAIAVLLLLPLKAAWLLLAACWHVVAFCAWTFPASFARIIMEIVDEVKAAKMTEPEPASGETAHVLRYEVRPVLPPEHLPFGWKNLPEWKPWSADSRDNYLMVDKCLSAWPPEITGFAVRNATGSGPREARHDVGVLDDAVLIKKIYAGKHDWNRSHKATTKARGRNDVRIGTNAVVEGIDAMIANYESNGSSRDRKT